MIASAASSVSPWTLIPTYWETTKARSLRGWSLEELADRADVSLDALAAYEERGDVLPLHGPGLMRLRRAFELAGLVFDENGLHDLGAPSLPPYDQMAEALMIKSSFERFADLHVRKQMAN